YGVTEDAIAKANPSAYPSDLQPGERLIIPNPKRLPQMNPAIPANLPEADAGLPAPGGVTTTVTTTASSIHTVRKGESLSKIAAAHKTSMSAIMSANKIKNPNKILLGQRLIIPGRKIIRQQPQKAPTQPTAPEMANHLQPPQSPPAPPSAPLPPAAPMGTPGGSTPTLRGIVSYRIQPGDTLDSVASLFTSTVENIRALNKHLGPGNPKVGTEIYVPTVGAVSLN
ncbi:MAG: LysM peptidoglycan-binding domain-containing protein, partial [Prosthecobacter sp.]|nr:LysM peptidoglycan-binding domain-containing protein [Prosthecobacter sp.]